MRERLEQLLKDICKTQNVTVGKTATLLELLNLPQVKDYIGNEQLIKGLNFSRIIATKLEHGEKVSKKQTNLAGANLDTLADLLARKQAGQKIFENVLPYMSEANTRKIYIDTYLREASWEVLSTDNLIQPLKAAIELKVEGMPNNKGVGFCDYVLFGANGLPLAVIEAKRTSEKVEAGKHQATLYADCLEKKYKVRPVIYYTNGYDLWVVDGLYPPRQIYAYHTAEELLNDTFRRQSYHFDDHHRYPAQRSCSGIKYEQ